MKRHIKKIAKYSSLKSSVLFLAALLPLSLTLSLTSQAFDISALGGVTISNFSQATPLAASSSGGTGYGVGGLVNLGLVPIIGIETGLFYMQHTVNLTNIPVSGQNGSITSNNLSLPIMLRFTPVKFFSVEAGGYLGLSATASETITSSNSSSTSSLTGVNDNGLIGGVSLNVPLMPGLYARFSGFYEYGLTNLSSGASPAVNTRNIDLLAGIMIGI